MKRVRQSGTAAELKVRRLLWSLGARYRVDVKGFPGRPDILNQSRGKAVLVHGCFWHAHVGCKRAKIPRRNRSFWKNKFETNRYRDEQSSKQLQSMGYDVLVVWECQLAEIASLKRKLRQFWFCSQLAQQ